MRVIGQVHPTAFFGVPRVWEKIQAGIRSLMSLEQDEAKREAAAAAMATGLEVLGIENQLLSDGLWLRGAQGFGGGTIDSRGDHRIAMALAVAGLLADGTTEIEDAECVEISYPGFFDQLESLC